MSERRKEGGKGGRDRWSGKRKGEGKKGKGYGRVRGRGNLLHETEGDRRL